MSALTFVEERGTGSGSTRVLPSDIYGPMKLAGRTVGSASGVSPRGSGITVRSGIVDEASDTATMCLVIIGDLSEYDDSCMIAKPIDISV